MRISNYRLIAIAVIILNSSVLVFGQVVKSDYFDISLADWKLVDSKKTRYTPEKVLAEADDYYRKINDYLFGKIPEPKNSKILITIMPSDYADKGCWAKNHQVSINVAWFNRNCLPLAHEITHLIQSSKSLESYSEGLADYFQNRLTPEKEQQAIYKGDADAKCKAYWMHRYNEKNIDKIIDGKQYTGLCIESESLVKYLINRFGVGKFEEYFNGDGYKSYKEVFGYSENDIKKDWTQYVLSREPEKSWIENWSDLEKALDSYDKDHK